MANVVFNVAKGGVGEKIADGANIGILLLTTTGLQADAALVDNATVAAIISAGNTEATFTNYTRKTVANASITRTVDNTNDRVDVTIANQTWTSAGGATNNTLGKMIVYEDVGGADSTRIPLTAHDFSATTDGNNLVAQISTVLYRAS